MADAYVDLEQTASTASSPYANWGDAAADMQTAITQAGTGGRVFVRIDGDGVGTTKDTASGNRILSFPGTSTAPFGLYGVKDATTATPPTDSDLCVRGTDILPVFETTGNGTLTCEEASGGSDPIWVIHGIRFDSDSDLIQGTILTSIMYDCELDFDRFFSIGVQSALTLYNCEIIFFDATSQITGNGPSKMRMYGGLLSGTAPTILLDGNLNGGIEFYGVDISLVAGTLVDATSARTFRPKFINCQLATGVTRFTGTPANDSEVIIELIGCSDETGLGSGESVRDYALVYPHSGTVLNEATFVRTGGVNGGVSGWSYAMTTTTSATKEGLLSIITPWFGGVVEGDATTSKDFTIYISNSSGSDMTAADAWVEILYPSEAGTTNHGFDVSSRTSIDASAPTITDDTVSDWSTGAGGNNAQQIVIAKTPDYQGPVYARVHFAQAGTNTLYVDPKVYVTDT